MYVNKALTANDVCGWYNTKQTNLRVLPAFMLSHCPILHHHQVSCNTLLPQSALLSDPDPQTFSQPVVHPLWELPTDKLLLHTEDKTLHTTFPSCLS